MSWGAIGATVAGAVVAHNSQPDAPGTPGRAEEFRIGGRGLFTGQVDHRRGQDLIEFGPRRGSELHTLQNRGIRDAGLFNNFARSNAGSDLSRSLGMDFLGGLSAFNPADIAAQQFGLLSPILNDQFSQERLDLEGRQFAQGRLGSTGGSQDFNALLDSQNDARRQLLFDSFGQGLQAQAQQANIGSSLLQLDPQLRGLFQGLGTNALTNSLNIQTAANNTFQTAASVAGAGGAPQSGFNTGQALGAGLLNAGVSNLPIGQDNTTVRPENFTSGNPHR